MSSSSASSTLVTTSVTAETCVKNLTRNNQNCNLTYFRTSVSGEAEECEYKAYNSEVITGQIDTANLNSDSYKEFGFEDPERWKELRKESNMRVKSRALSDSELRPLSLYQQTALALFTTSAYVTLNRYLHESPRAGKIDSNGPENEWHTPVNGRMSRNLEEELAHSITSDTEEADKERQQYKCATRYALDLDPNPKNITPSFLTSYVDTVDEAFSKADGRQRIVYRGECFIKDDGHFAGYKNMHEYAEAKYKVGNQVSFKGMQSTSVDADTAKSYADEGGLIYEISTPSGIALSSVSAYDTESEVLLPRNSTYAVVGKKHIAEHKKHFVIVQLVEVDENSNIRHEGNLRKKDEFGEFDTTKFEK